MVSQKPLAEALVAGVDGCRAGWIYVVVEIDDAGPAFHSMGLSESFTDLIEAVRTCQAVCVDMPIGFSADGLRQADIEARRLVGPRRSSVFPPPPRALLTAEGDYAALNALSKTIRVGLPKQAYNILAKMREVDGVMTPRLQAHVRETHPEVSFCTFKGDYLRHAKRTRQGARERLDLLTSAYGEVAREWRPPRGAAMDDLYDAAILAWTASRVWQGEARTLPAEPPRDARGLRMEIVY